MNEKMSGKKHSIKSLKQFTEKLDEQLREEIDLDKKEAEEIAKNKTGEYNVDMQNRQLETSILRMEIHTLLTYFRISIEIMSRLEKRKKVEIQVPENIEKALQVFLNHVEHSQKVQREYVG